MPGQPEDTAKGRNWSMFLVYVFFGVSGSTTPQLPRTQNKEIQLILTPFRAILKKPTEGKPIPLCTPGIVLEHRI